MTRRLHDADLCEQIRKLEKRVEELESKPTHHYCGHYCNHWHFTPSYPYTVWSSNDAISSTYTDNLSSTSTFSINNSISTN